MRRAAITIGVFAVLGFVGGFLFATLTKNVVPTMKDQRAAGPTRTVPENWPQVRLSPGHSQHVINERLECNECHDPADETFKTPDTGVCTQCHEDQASLAHVDLDGMPMDCYTCHIYGSEPEVFGRWHCTRCHGPFQSEGLPGLAMHASVPCESCHNPHKPSEETIRECDECHKKMNVQHGRSSLSGSCGTAMGGTRSPPMRRPAWSVTGQRSQRCRRPRHSAMDMIRARPAMRRMRFPRRVHFGVPLVTRERRSWHRTGPGSIVTAAVVTNLMRCERRETKLAKAVTTTCPRRITRKARETASDATIRTPSGERRSLLNAHNATMKLGLRLHFMRARCGVRPAISLIDST